MSTHGPTAQDSTESKWLKQTVWLKVQVFQCFVSVAKTSSNFIIFRGPLTHDPSIFQTVSGHGAGGSNLLASCWFWVPYVLTAWHLRPVFSTVHWWAGSAVNNVAPHSLCLRECLRNPSPNMCFHVLIDDFHITLGNCPSNLVEFLEATCYFAWDHHVLLNPHEFWW